MSDDAALAARIAAGAAARDLAAEAELYRRLAPRVRLSGLRHLRDPHAAADLVQHVLLLAIERLRAGRVREPERIASYVLGAARMTALEMRPMPAFVPEVRLLAMDDGGEREIGRYRFDHIPS